MDQNQFANELISSYFLQQWRHNSQTLTLSSTLSNPGTESDSARPDLEYEDEGEEFPTELDTVSSSGGFSVVGPDKLSVLYPNVNLHGHDVGVVHANCAAPSKRLLYYFEMYVKNAGAKGQIAIGFIPSSFKVRRHPGKNGVLVGTVFKDVKSPVIPTVAVHSQGEEVTVNFGKEPFVFDIKAYEAEQRAIQQEKIDCISIPLDASHGLVRSYLEHYGYEGTLEFFDMASKSTTPPISLVPENGFDEEDNMYAMNQRRTLRELIRRGGIDETFAKLHEWYPQIVQDDTSSICFLLHTQKFIELVRVGKLEEAVLYGRSEFEKFKRRSEFDDLVKDCAALLAYEQPDKSSVGYVLRESQRELVADAVNATILATNPNVKDAKCCLQSRLERLLRQLTACFLEKRSLNGGDGEAFHLRRILKSGQKG
ncbi:ran-binding protein M homolog isoform X2 [Olea europaea var. sylvestris]|uniref:ran-binding protein M homolog isoform X2 n=1 Tax=Olea europaea var. sylvestris TaxID=158386 RepID=UPI000C1D0B66|nr:ran-binding protein M homolog isoform X2 [Olea europaea var. sylvestris]